MKRYNENYHRCEMEESEDGYWVSFDDVSLMKLALDSAIADIEELSKELKILHGDDSK